MSIYNYIWSHLPHAASDADEFTIPDLPGITIHRSQLFRNMLSAASPDHPSAIFVHRLADHCRRSGATLWNTADALEKLFLDAWARSSGLPVFANRLLAGEAAALEGQGRPFLWAVPVLDQAPKGVVGEGVRLLVRDWVPQIEILRHAAMGVFVSYYGWNSSLESMRHGVPMIAWPLRSKQFYNAKLMAEELGVCVEVGSAGEAVAALAEVMGEGERGREIRRRAREVTAELEAVVKEP